MTWEVHLDVRSRCVRFVVLVEVVDVGSCSVIVKSWLNSRLFVFVAIGIGLYFFVAKFVVVWFGRDPLPQC